MLVHKYESTQRRNTADYKMNRLGSVNLKYGDCNPIKVGISVKGLSLKSCARHEYVTAVLPKIQVFWEVEMNLYASICRRFERPLCLHLQA